MSCADQRTCAQCEVEYCLADYGICERKETLGALSAPVEGSVLNARQIVFFYLFWLYITNTSEMCVLRRWC